MIIDQMKKDRLLAMKRHNKKLRSILGLVIADMERKQDTSDQSAMKSIKAIQSSNRESLNNLEPGSLQAQELVWETITLEEYLPEKIVGNDLRAFVEDYLKQIDKPSMRDMGGVMAKLRETGKDFNGKEVKDYVQAFLN